MNNGSAPVDIYDPAYVKNVFDKCSNAYIRFSYYCSFGFTERWRSQCAALLGDLPPKSKGYDLMAGTGEAWPHLLKLSPDISQITAVDVSSGMHDKAMVRLHNMRSDKIGFIENDILKSDLPDESADFVICTFGLKTFNAAQHKKLAALTARILKPGGRFAFIEASDPTGWILRPLYIFHLTKFLPLIERFFLRGATDFAMIGTYSQNFGNASDFCNQLLKAGLSATYQKHFFGCATSASGSKPEG